MAKAGADDYEQYLRLLRDDPEQWSLLIDTVLINVSSFFRTPLVFETLAKEILPSLLARKRQEGTPDIRIWSAGCGRGEEPYSLAILLVLAAERNPKYRWPLIFATDTNAKALEAARRGYYPRESFHETRLGILDKHFAPEDDGFVLDSPARSLVRFSMDDLGSNEEASPTDSVFGSFDLVLCRNVLIYYSRKV